MYTLLKLRTLLAPHYGHYTDAVISLIGLNPHEETLKAVLSRDLSEAHAAQLDTSSGAFSMYEFSSEGRPHLAALRWSSKQVPIPSWIDKPLRKIPTNCPQVVEAIEGDTSGARIGFFLGGREIGSALVREHGLGKNKILLVGQLQQHTVKANLSSKHARRFSRWKHVAMNKMEEIARRSDYKLILFSTGEFHALHSISKKPIHEEILDTYGRLLLRHGYSLITSPRTLFPSVMISRPYEHLAWMKRL